MSVFKFRYFKGMGHTQVKVFAGPDWDHLALTGTLMLLHEEWDLLKYMVGHHGENNTKLEEEGIDSKKAIEETEMYLSGEFEAYKEQ
jgi:hypothetical protein